MSFQTGLSGLNAASQNLDVIGNNIANANTVGMKSSRAEFSDVVAAALGPGGGADVSNQAGIGVQVSTIAQQFSQGNISITGNNLDLAINGNGFFQVTNKDGSSAYSRDGQFKLDSSGFLVTNSGANVMGYPTDTLGNTTSTTPQKLMVPTGAPIPAKETTTVTAQANLNANAIVFNSVTPNTPLGTYGTAVTAFDSQGTAVPVSLAFQKTASDTWTVYDTSTSTNPGAPTTPTLIGTLKFNANGNLASSTNGLGVATAAPGVLTDTLWSSNTSTINSFPVTIDLSKMTQYGTSFAVSNLQQDGYTAGNLTSVTINSAGVLTTNYSNGQTQAMGQVALAEFRNVQGLKPVGGEWLQSASSGPPISGSPSTGNFGSIQSGALEDSNVDLTAELVNLMTAQRDYQANSQTIKTQDQVLQTLVNLR